jgi:propionate CoA-transferase
VFGGTLTAGGLKVAAEGGRLTIVNEGKHRKFVPELEQISYNGGYARERGQVTLFVTERAVFQTSEHGLEIIEIAPGIDLETQVLGQMNFRPHVSDKLRLMDARLFRPEAMGLAAQFAGKQRALHPRLAS